MLSVGDTESQPLLTQRCPATPMGGQRDHPHRKGSVSMSFFFSTWAREAGQHAAVSMAQEDPAEPVLETDAMGPPPVEES